MPKDLRIEFVSSTRIQALPPSERIDYLIDVIKGGSIIVLDDRLDPEDERVLIERTMEMIDDKFTGIEISTLGDESRDLRSRLIKLLGGKVGGLTVIGPAKVIKRMKKDRDSIDLLAGFKR